MERPISPCTKDCERRHVGCRSECPDGIQYEKEYAEYREWLNTHLVSISKASNLTIGRKNCKDKYMKYIQKKGKK